jgi:DNA polymerase-3 subunit alpha
MLSLGYGTGVFQFESAGMKDSLRKIKPDRVEDLIALGALYRPGPMDNIPTYVACKHGRQQPDYLHPKLKPILEETYGVIIYQEQVLEIARVLAGYSLGAADMLRRAMGKKIKSEMDAQEKIFVDGAIANGVDPSQAKDIFNAVAKFAGYGFNKAHAASYGVISYYTAYLKANYTADFIVSCLNLDIGDHQQIAVFLDDAQDFGIKATAPDINLSTAQFSIQTHYDEQPHTKSTHTKSIPVKSIVYAFGAIKNVTQTIGENIVQERKKGKFSSVINFIERMGHKVVGKKSLESLIKSGCFDKLHDNRHMLLESVPNLLIHAERYAKEKSSRQASFFSNTDKAVISAILVDVEEFSTDIKLGFEFDTLGLFSSSHPLQKYIPVAKEFGVTLISDIKHTLVNGSYCIKMMCTIQSKDARMSHRGRFITMHVSDPTGMIIVSIFSEDVINRASALINVKQCVLLTCDVHKDDGNIKITVTNIQSIDAIDKMHYQNISINVENMDDLKECATNLYGKKISDLISSSSGVANQNIDANINIRLRLNDFFTAEINVVDKFSTL